MTMTGMDTFTEQAMGLLTSSRLAEALDLSKEDPKVVARYGKGDPTISMDGNGAPRVPQSLLVARRLIEAGVRVVTLNYSKWDWHGGTNAEGTREQLDLCAGAGRFSGVRPVRECARRGPASTRSG